VPTPGGQVVLGHCLHISSGFKMDFTLQSGGPTPQSCDRGSHRAMADSPDDDRQDGVDRWKEASRQPNGRCCRCRLPAPWAINCHIAHACCGRNKLAVQERVPTSSLVMQVRNRALERARLQQRAMPPRIAYRRQIFQTSNRRVR
jgi:hypothetical protein